MTDSGTKHGPRENDLPDWAVELIALYESKASSQFILYGNVEDRLLLPGDDSVELGNLADFLMCVMLPRFDVVLSYDLGNGIRIEKGERFSLNGRISRRIRSYPNHPAQRLRFSPTTSATVAISAG